MTIEHSEKADLRPLNGQILLALGFEDIEDDGDTIFIVVTDDTLVGISSIALDDATLLLRGFGWLVIFQEECLWVKHRWILSKEQGLNLHKLDVSILRVLVGEFGVTIGIVSICFHVG